MQRHFYVHAWRHIDEAPAGPYSRVQGSKLVIVVGDYCAKILLNEIGILSQSIIHAQKDYSLVFKLFFHLVVDNLRFVLGGHAAWYAEPKPTQEQLINATSGAFRLAGELDIDLLTLKGSGAGGRITAGDVRKAAQ